MSAKHATMHGFEDLNMLQRLKKSSNGSENEVKRKRKYRLKRKNYVGFVFVGYRRHDAVAISLVDIFNASL